jgi:hypothetical protein
MHKLPMIFQPQPSACYFMHNMILPQSILGIFVTNDLRKGVSFQKKMLLKMCMMKGFHSYHLGVGMIGDSLV